MHIKRELIPQYILDIANILHSNNFESNLVGGSIRDILIGRIPNDYDLTTNATPQELISLFPSSIQTGIKFGTVKVLVEDNGEMKVVDITTYRSEEDYIKGRWPSKVIFTKTIHEDLSRRDFTINAIALNLNTYEIIDPFNGEKDIQDKIIKSVGNPLDRFLEDGLRPFRACRLASTLEFQIEDNTFEAIPKSLNNAIQISIERIRDEFVRLVMESPIPSIGVELMRKSGLLNIFMPELLEGYKMMQNTFHEFDVYHHLLLTMDLAPKDIRLAALLHDIAKPRTKSGDHYYGHDIEGEKMARQIMTRMKFSKNEMEKICRLVRWHMFYYPENKYDEQLRTESEQTVEKDAIEQQRKNHRNIQMAQGWEDNAIRRFVSRIGGIDNINELIELRIADASSTNSRHIYDSDEIRRLQGRIADVLNKDNALKITDLNIKGQELIDLGIERGPQMKKIFDELLEIIIEDPSMNTNEQLRIEVIKLKENLN